jgi:hypothetical protein
MRMLALVMVPSMQATGSAVSRLTLRAAGRQLPNARSACVVGSWTVCACSIPTSVGCTCEGAYLLH